MISTKPNWSSFWWIIRTIIVPITVPCFFYNLFVKYKENNNKNRLPGKVVVITGASSGLGEALAHTFYKAGCKVVLAARRTNELERVKNELIATKTSGRIYTPMILSLDLTNINTLPEKTKEILDAYGQIDILINNGGISVRSDVLSTEMDVDIKVMLVNYFGTIAMTKSVLPSMIEKKRGRIVCVSSVQGKCAIPHRSAYTASKHALQAFCDTLRAELHEHNIKVTVISPGYINTALSLNALTGSGVKYGVLDKTTEGGVSPQKMSDDILKAILQDKEDVIFATTAPKAAYYLRHICPSLYFWIMAKRAKKLSHSLAKSD